MPQRPKGFVINLAASPRRLDSARAELVAAQIDPIRVDAFDGREIDLAQFAAYDDDKARRFMGRSMTQGEVGCYVSHQRAASEPIFCPADNMLRQVLTRSDMGLGTARSLVTAGRFDSDISARSGGNRGKFRRSPLYGLRKQRRLLHEKAMAFAHKLGHR